MEKIVSRYRVLTGTMLLMVISGALQAFSVFGLPLSRMRGWEVADVMTAFGIASIMTPLCMILSGRFLSRGIAAPVMLVGGTLFGGGYFLASFAHTKTLFLLCAGGIVGFGQGLMYAASLTNIMRFFPDRRAMAAGFTTAAMAAGSLIIAPLSHQLITRWDPATALAILGISYMVITVLSVTLFIRSYPLPGKNAPATAPAPTAPGADVDIEGQTRPGQMLKNPLFYHIFFIFLCMSFSEVLVLSQLAPMAEGIGLSGRVAALLVAFFAVVNGLSRIACGQLADRYGIITCLNVVIIIETVALFVMAYTEPRGAVTIFAISALIMGVPFGAVMSLFAPLTMKVFGHKYHGSNYGLMFCAFAIGSFFSSRWGAVSAAAHGGSYSYILYIGCAIAGIAAILSFLLRSRKIDA